MNADDAAATPPLAALRSRLDRLDAEIAELVGERMAVVAEVAAAKGPGSSVLRPEREAEILERRLAEADPRVRPDVTAQLVRLLITAACLAQRPLTVHVAKMVEAARYLYASAPVQRHQTPEAALAALAQEPHDVAILAEDEAVDWALRGDAHAILRAPLSDGGAALVLAGAAVDRAEGPVRIALAGGTPVVSDATDGETLGQVHTFPVLIPVTA